MTINDCMCLLFPLVRTQKYKYNIYVYKIFSSTILIDIPLYHQIRYLLILLYKTLLRVYLKNNLCIRSL